MEEGIMDATHSLFFLDDMPHIDGVSISLNNSVQYELWARGNGTLEASEYDVQVNEPATAISCLAQVEVCAKLMADGGDTDRGGVGYEAEGSVYQSAGWGFGHQNLALSMICYSQYTAMKIRRNKLYPVLTVSPILVTVCLSLAPSSIYQKVGDPEFKAMITGNLTWQCRYCWGPSTEKHVRWSSCHVLKRITHLVSNDMKTLWIHTIDGHY